MVQLAKATHKQKVKAHIHLEQHELESIEAARMIKGLNDPEKLADRDLHATLGKIPLKQIVDTANKMRAVKDDGTRHAGGSLLFHGLQAHNIDGNRLDTVLDGLVKHGVISKKEKGESKGVSIGISVKDIYEEARKSTKIKDSLTERLHVTVNQGGQIKSFNNPSVISAADATIRKDKDARNPNLGKKAPPKPPGIQKPKQTTGTPTSTRTTGIPAPPPRIQKPKQTTGTPTSTRTTGIPAPPPRIQKPNLPKSRPVPPPVSKPVSTTAQARQQVSTHLTTSVGGKPIKKDLQPPSLARYHIPGFQPKPCEFTVDMGDVRKSKSSGGGSKFCQATDQAMKSGREATLTVGGEEFHIVCTKKPGAISRITSSVGSVLGREAKEDCSFEIWVSQQKRRKLHSQSFEDALNGYESAIQREEK